MDVARGGARAVAVRHSRAKMRKYKFSSRRRRYRRLAIVAPPPGLARAARHSGVAASCEDDRRTTSRARVRGPGRAEVDHVRFSKITSFTMMFKVVTETLGVANVLRTPIYANICRDFTLYNSAKAHRVVKEQKSSDQDILCMFSIVRARGSRMTGEGLSPRSVCRAYTH